jgi:hypothetical protein
MPIISNDQLIQGLGLGKTYKSEFNKITGAAAYTANRFYDMSILNGYPIANTYSGTALAFQNTNASSGFSIYSGGDTLPDIKYMISCFANTGVATGVPGVISIYDMQGYYPGINMNVNTLQTLTGTPTLRYTNGQGVRAYLVSTVASGATAHNLSMSYTNQAATAGRVFPFTVSMIASAIVGHISHSGGAANNYGPFLPMASGDFGIQSVQTVQLSAASGAGTAALVLARPIVDVPLTLVGVANERDLVNQIPSLPEIKEGACLIAVLKADNAVAASTNYYGSFRTVWG